MADNPVISSDHDILFDLRCVVVPPSQIANVLPYSTDLSRMRLSRITQELLSETDIPTPSPSLNGNISLMRLSVISQSLPSISMPIE